MPKERNHVPCRVCGIAHTNPMSSSICGSCGPLEMALKAYRARCERAEQQRRQATARELAWDRLSNATTVSELRDWLTEHVFPTLYPE